MNARYQAQFDIAINHFNQGRTVLDTKAFKDLTRRTAAIDAARTEFQKLIKGDSATIAWQSMAWLMKCSIEGGQVGSASKRVPLLCYFAIGSAQRNPKAKAV